jgi:hypothetical protein
MEQLLQYYRLISYGVERLHWFVNEADWDLMHVYLYSEEYNQITGDAVINGFENKSSPPYLFNCMRKEEVVEILITNIEYHTFIAETVAEILYDWGYDEAFMYLNTAA